MSEMFDMYFDLEGNPIWNAHAKSQKLIMPMIFVTIFPDKRTNKSYAVFTYHKKEEGIFSKLMQQIHRLQQHERNIFLTNLIPTLTEHFAFKPSFYQSLSDSEKNSLKDILQITELDMSLFKFSQNGEPVREDRTANLLKDNGINFFRGFEFK